MKAAEDIACFRYITTSMHLAVDSQNAIISSAGHLIKRAFVLPDSSSDKVIRWSPYQLQWQGAIAPILLGLAMLLYTIPCSAQDITYNYDPEYQLGEELWSIPISGEMTLSQDGTKLLIATLTDNTFYVVDAINGVILRKLPVSYFSTGQRTYYCTDPELTRLWVVGNDSTRTSAKTWLVDIEKATIIYELEGARGTGGISTRQDRILDGDGLYTASTHELLWRYDSAGVCWFDDERGVFYRITNRLLTEYDGATGQPIRQIGMEATRGFVRRPKNSDWIYVFASDMTTSGDSHWVLAFHAETGERVVFKEFWNRGVPMPGGPNMTNSTAFVGTTGSEAFSSGVAGVAGRDLQPVWLFNADALHVRTLLNPSFELEDRKASQESQIDLERLRFIHGWAVDWQDSAITRCNQLIPATTGISEQPTSQAVWLQETSSELSISLPEGTVVRSIDIADLRGQHVMHIDGPSLLHRPIRIPTASLNSGTYVCLLDLESRTLSSTFFIVR